MNFGTLLLGAVLILAAGASPMGQAAAATQDCPIQDFDLDKIEEAARTAPTCDRSLELFRLCGSGATSDVQLGAAVTERCEGDFLARLSKAQQAEYRRAQSRCARKYAHETGTMYRSFEAFCAAEVARSFARRLAKPRLPR
jgi:hypothetical protein